MNAILTIEQLSFIDDAYPESLFRLYASDRRTLFLVATNEVDVVGYIIARTDRWGAEIVSIAVHPSVRKRGIGTLLVTAAIRRMRRRKAQSLRLMVHENNSVAAEFYRRHGFRSVGRVKDYYEDGGTGIRMRLPLTSGGNRVRHPQKSPSLAQANLRP